MAQIIPAILTDDDSVYKKQLALAEHLADVIQIDVIDGQFAKNTTVDVDIIAKNTTHKSLEIQLMVKEPKAYIDKLIGLDFVTRIILPVEIPAETVRESLYTTKKHGKQVGLSLNPQTPISVISDYFDIVDMVLLLAVNPGFAGQKFNEIVLTKIKDLRKLGQTTVEVDGGVNFENMESIVAAGFDLIAANSIIFKADDPVLAFEKLAKLAQTRQ